MEDKLRATAFHEAGHAAMAEHLGLAVRWVTIVPDDDAGTLGGVMGLGPPKYVRDWLTEGGLSIYTPVPLRVRDYLERDILSLFAGGLAQEKATGTTEGSAQTYDHPTHGVVVVDGDEHAIAERIGWLTYGDEDSSTYYEWLRARTVVMLDQLHIWKAVEHIAAALLEEPRLSGARVRTLATEARARLFEAELATRRRGGPFDAQPE